MKYYLLLLIMLVGFGNLAAKEEGTDANVFGDVQSNGRHIRYVSVFIDGTNIGTTTDASGHYMLTNLPVGRHIIVARAIGYETAKDTIELTAGKSIEVNFELTESGVMSDEVVVTGTRTKKKITESPVMVNVVDNESMQMVQACNISESLRFQPGLRVETDCQTCNYTQLRMNGMGGSYSQILINGRPIFSPLIGLYGLEQIPSNMVEKIEVVRGGGSALYGSSAVGGTVNIITKIPHESGYEVSLNTQSIRTGASDNIINGNISMVNDKRDAGAAIFINRRNREAFDVNNDNFSELPSLETNSFGANLFYMPDFDQKIEMNFSSLYEYRYGGEMINEQAYRAAQSEERVHNIFMGGVDYQINFNNDKSSFISYAAGQKTTRDHYTGIFPDSEEDIDNHLSNPPYGYTDNTTLQAGVQLNHQTGNFITGNNILTFGLEYIYDDVLDKIPAYNYEIDQISRNAAAFAQLDWEIVPVFTLLAGLRADKNNFVDEMILSPRLSMMYDIMDNTQLRFSWATGFRAPQAFDADMHVAFAGGGVSRISLAPGLKEERSNSISSSINYDKATTNFIAGFTLEGFYTRLSDAFYLQPAGSDNFGELFEKRNGPGATVKGFTFEVRANYDLKAQIEGGVTFQSSEYDNPVENIDGLEAKSEFLRTPDRYGYLTFSYTPGSQIEASVSTVYTGPMLLAHFGGAPEQQEDVYTTSEEFFEINFKLSYTIMIESIHTGLEIFGGIKNLTDSYQSDFDTGKNRDSNYIYGPSLPRTYFMGLSVKSN